MIVADVGSLRDQVILTPNMAKGLEFLLQLGQDELPDGRVLIDDLRVYAEVQSYNTVEGEVAEFEGHRTYIDIQYVVSGQEIIAWASISKVTETTPYVAADDYWLATTKPGNVTHVRLAAGQLAVMYPADLHAPRRADGTSVPVKKIVVKVAIDG